MANEICTKVVAEALASGLDGMRREIERAKDEVRAAEARVADCEKKLADQLAWLARVLEGIPMAKLNEEKK